MVVAIACLPLCVGGPEWTATGGLAFAFFFVPFCIHENNVRVHRRESKVEQKGVEIPWCDGFEWPHQRCPE